MAKVYGNLEGLKEGMPKPVVIPFYLKEEFLNVENMKTLMSCAGGEAALPLYLEVSGRKSSLQSSPSPQDIRVSTSASRNANPIT